jgi:hypothetical protein
MKAWTAVRAQATRAAQAADVRRKSPAPEKEAQAFGDPEVEGVFAKRRERIRFGKSP